MPKYAGTLLLAVMLVLVAVVLIKQASSLRDDAGGAIPAATHKCTARETPQGSLPDAVCTPGAIDPAVTQDNLKDTICKSGYTKTVRPSSSYTNKLKKQGMADYGYSDTDLKHYEEDHLISLELGGSPKDPANLWPEFPDSPNPKDKIENKLHDMICAGEISLAEAQRRIATDWTTALAGLP